MRAYAVERLAAMTDTIGRLQIQTAVKFSDREKSVTVASIPCTADQVEEEFNAFRENNPNMKPLFGQFIAAPVCI